MFLDLREFLDNAKFRGSRDFSGAQDWDEMSTKFAKELVLTASSYQPQRLFPVAPTTLSAAGKEEGAFEVSPQGGFMYTEVLLPQGQWLDLAQGNRRGHVCFDGEIAIPRINAARSSGNGFRRDPWMSLTPMEILTQRPALRRSKGHVVVAGLGMGWLLQRVAEKKSVKKVTLVEISQELIDWILPRLYLQAEVEVRCGDAYDIVPNLEADVALIDIWMGYGGNRFPRCKDIDYVWCWGG